MTKQTSFPYIISVFLSLILPSLVTGQTPFIYDVDFTESDHDWTFHDVPGVFDSAAYSRDGGLTLSPAGSAACFSWWESPVFPVSQEQDIRIHWKVRANSFFPAACPSFRLRVNSYTLTDSTLKAIESIRSGDDSPDPLAIYTLDYRVPPTVNAVMLSFDLLSFQAVDDLNSTLILERVWIEPIPAYNHELLPLEEFRIVCVPDLSSDLSVIIYELGSGHAVGTYGDKDADGYLILPAGTIVSTRSGKWANIERGAEEPPDFITTSDGWTMELWNFTTSSTDVRITPPAGSSHEFYGVPLPPTVASPILQMEKSSLRQLSSQVRWSWLYAEIAACLFADLAGRLGLSAPEFMEQSAGGVGCSAYFTNQMELMSRIEREYLDCVRLDSETIRLLLNGGGGVFGQAQLSIGTILNESGVPSGRGYVEGRVLDAATGGPIVSARLTFRNEFGVLAGVVQTGNQGRFSLHMNTGAFAAEVTQANYVSTQLYGEIIEDTAVYTDDVLLAVYTGQPGTMVGTIYDAANSTPLTGATVVLRQGVGAKTGSISASTTSGSSGVYRFENIAEGTYTAEVIASGYANAYRVVVCLGGQSTVNQDVGLEPGGKAVKE